LDTIRRQRESGKPQGDVGTAPFGKDVRPRPQGVWDP